MSSAIAVSNESVRRIPIVPAVAIVALAVAHWFLTLYCHISYDFSGAWFPFSFTESPDHQMWQAFVTIAEFPLASVTRLAGLAETDLHGIMQMLNSLLWGVVIYLGSSRLIRRVRR